jgi:acyl-CoA thioesterase II
VTVQRYPYRATAWFGDELVAQSDACLCDDREGEPAVLYFPQADIDLARLGSETSVLTMVSEPAGDQNALHDHGTFDPERVRVEVVDAVAGEDERDATVKEFPTWGDAAHLIDMLTLRQTGDLSWAGAARTDGRRPVVEGSQMLGQSIVAAMRHAPGRRVVSAHMLFLRGADAARPLDFELAELSAGRTFTGVSAQVRQGGRCCAAGTILLDSAAPPLVQHAADAPDVPGPYDSPPYDMGVTGRDLRVVDAAYTNDSDAPLGPPLIDCWVRFRQVPEDPAIHAGLLAQFTGHIPIAAALRPHDGVGQDQAHRTLSMGINAINLSLHREVRADRWMLYRHLSTFAGDGMTHAECRVHDEDGHLLASFSVDAMVRSFGNGDRSRDERTAL